MKRRLVVIKKATAGESQTPVITISAQPTNQSTSNGNATFEVTASVTQGATLNYQWERSIDGGLNWSALSGQTYAGIFLSSLTVSSDQYQYRVVCSATGATSVTSSAATLSVVPVVSISSQPTNQSASNGSASFSVSASITLGGSATVQWQRSTDGGSNYSNLSGETSNSLSLSGLTVSSNNYKYRAVVSGSNGASSVTSNAATLTVQPVLSISAQPTNQSTSDGNATFSVTATSNMGGSVTGYQWYRSTDGGSSFSLLSGQTSSTLSLSSLTVSSNDYKYYVVAFGDNSQSPVQSNTVTLTIAPVVTITSQPTNQTSTDGSASFSVSASINLGSTITYYQWYRSTNGGATFSTINGSPTLSTLSLSNLTVGANNFQYYVVVFGNLASGVQSNTVTLTTSPQLSISTQPTNQSTSDGSATFSISGASFNMGATVTSYQWQRSTDGGSNYSNLSGETSTSLSLSSLTVSSDQYKYRVIVYANGGAYSGFSNAATLSVVPVVSISSQPTNQTEAGAAATFSVTASITLSGTLSYQWQQSTDGGSSFSDLAGKTSSSLSLSSLTIASNGYQYRCVVGGSNNASSVNSNAATLTVYGFNTASQGVAGGVALKNSYAWGWGSTNFLNNTTSSVSSPISVTLTNKQWKYIAPGSTNYITALDGNSNAWCWGTNAFGILGNNTTTNSSTPVSVVGNITWKQISTAPHQLSAHMTAGLDSNGYCYAWGGNTLVGALGNNVATASASSPVSVVGGKQFSVISNGGGSGGVLALDQSSYAFAWGIGFCGDNTGFARSSPVSVVGGRQWRQISQAAALRCALDSNSYCYTWGNVGATGALGLASTQTSAVSPVSVVGGRQWRQIMASVGPSSAYFIVALDQNSYCYAWGSNASNQLGDGTSTSKSSPISVIGGIQFNEVFAGNNSVIGRSGSNYYVWGGNVGSLVGLASTATVSSPTLWTNLPYGT